MRLRNVNPLGQVDLPLIGRQGEPLGEEGVGCLEPAEEFDCTPEHADNLLRQVGNYEAADDEARELADAIAAETEPAEPADQGEHDDDPEGDEPEGVNPEGDEPEAKTTTKRARAGRTTRKGDEQ